jgi:oxepin-CoA hydrolase/3-oxo-5,6-dehydrosuberyl-CoA semialdehyde dehydrogenase
VVHRGTRLNVEADSVNVAILGPDVAPGSETFGMFVSDVCRDLTQKAGQKCTAIRRVLVPEALCDDVRSALLDRLSTAVVGDPSARETTVGPVATPAQRDAVAAGLDRLASVGATWWRGTAPEGGCFVAPGLFAVEGGTEAPWVHDHEVFGPAATVLPWPGDAATAVAIAARGGGGLVGSVYSDDLNWSREVIFGLLPWHGRVHWGSAKVADQSPGPGTVLPTLVHGGPGRAGGGEELGGERGLWFYLQRTAVQGDRALLARVFTA